MSEPTAELTEFACDACQLRYLPTDGPCPRCGSRSHSEVGVPPVGTVLASTELEYPAEGWSAPHRLALLEVADKVRLLAIVDGPLPSPGDALRVSEDGLVYRASALRDAERGEGDSPRSGSHRPSFEPPR